ncbi:UvrD-helicase domain-containing protein [Candidatus Saccharibacteria bacterium]|nr:UvrD-helicase domain-containing protein [Candidatus Saccharibacteria bacterium]
MRVIKAKRKKRVEARAAEVQRWFRKSVTYEGEPYVMDLEQVRAVVSDDVNAIVVARAGSGKTRTIVAKIVYLIARCGAQPEEIMAFVFNANAAREINERLAEMTVDGVPVMGENDGGGESRAKKVGVAQTFHAFARHVVYDVCGGREKCGKILAGEKEEFVARIVAGMMREPKWEARMRKFGVDEQSVEGFGKMMAQFINRAQQKFLAGEDTLWKSIHRRYQEGEVGEREKLFIQLGAECYRRYHWYLLDGEARMKLKEFEGYGTDFNLLVSWASKLIATGGEGVRKLLGGKKYMLIDEYQDFSQLFLSVVMAIRRVVPEVRLFVVGDDWQAINRFAGSDVGYFKEFEKFFSPARRYEITTNYRCNYIIVDMAGKFMKKAMGEKGKSRAFAKRAGKVVLVDTKRVKAEYLVRLVELIEKNRKAEEILILHRNNDTRLKISLVGLGAALKREVVKAKVMGRKEFDEKVRVMTMHKSKGLEAEVVIILEADEGVIPKVHPDALLYGIFGETDEVVRADQMRLFYVAMTRAKKRLYIMHDFDGEAGFVKYLGRGVERWED